MKRSTHISLVLLASVSAMATLSGCDDTPPAKPDNGGTFSDLAECVKTYDQQTCQAAQKLAQQEHVKNAPHFSRREECIAEYGADMCAPASQYGGAGNFFVPMMVGYMMGSATSMPAPLYYGAGSYRHRNDRGYSAPIYTSGTGYSRQAPIGNAPFSSNRSGISTKGTMKSTTALTPPVSTRGGFGGTFKPTKTFTSNVRAAAPTGYTSPARTFSSSPSRAATYSSGAGYKASTSVSSRGGFGSTARSFGGGFGG